MVVVVFDDKTGSHSDNIFDVGAFLEGLKIPYIVPEIKDLYDELLDAFDRSEVLALPIVLWIDGDELNSPVNFTPSGLKIHHSHYMRNIFQSMVGPLLAQHQYHILEAKLAGADWRNIPAPVLPKIPDSLSPQWREIMHLYDPLFSVFKEIRGGIVTADTGVSSMFAFPPYDCIDLCTYMGGSLPLAIGAYLSGYRDVWAVTGDFSFISAGQLGLIESACRSIPLKTLICYNGKAQTTGGQPIPNGSLENILKGYERYVRYIVDPQDTAAVRAVLTEAHNAPDMRIIIADYRR
jgi:TPP-dependent indolepyruvate ferredoxin oxidoreductase alpha subunit